MVNKIDLLPHLDFDLDRSSTTSTRSTPTCERMLVSARTGEGVDGVAGLAARSRARPGASACVTRARRDPSARLRRAAARSARAANRAVLRRARPSGWRGCATLMAERFARGGRLIAFGRSPAARSDARHVAVEFVHPVIVGKRALPAIGLTGEGGDADRAGRAARRRPTTSRSRSGPGGRRRGRRGVAVARGARLPDDRVRAGAARSGSSSRRPRTRTSRQELVETLYHVLWELVHVFFEHRGLLEGRTERRVHDAGASSFLYPFLDERERDLDAGARRRAPLGADEGRGDRRAARADADREPPDAAGRRRRRCARSFERGRQAAGARQRRLGHRRDGRRRRLPGAAGRRGRRST